MKEKLVEIIDDVQKYCSHEGTYCCYCDYNKYNNHTCYKYWIADAIIESGLLKDEKVYPPKYVRWDEVFEDNEYVCTQCGASVFEEQPYCANCGAKLKETDNA